MYINLKTIVNTNKFMSISARMHRIFNYNSLVNIAIYMSNIDTFLNDERSNQNSGFLDAIFENSIKKRIEIINKMQLDSTIDFFVKK